VRCVPLPKFSGEALDVSNHLIAVIEPGMPAQGSVPEHPQVVVDRHDDVVVLVKLQTKCFLSFPISLIVSQRNGCLYILLQISYQKRKSKKKVKTKIIERGRQTN